MKKFNILFFIIPIIYGLLVFGTEGISALWTAPKTMAVLLMLTASGVVMQLGKPWGAFLSIVPFVVMSVEDYLRNYKYDWAGDSPDYKIAIPVIAYYIFCAVMVKRKKDK
jgi:hypothetical protein